MAKQHGVDTQITVATSDLSQHTNTSTLTRTGDSHDLTTYGAAGHIPGGGLKNHKFTMGGIYEAIATTTSPKKVLQPLLLTTVAIVRKPEGTGAGKPNEAFSALLKSYVETAPVADYISWSAEFEVSGDITDTLQP